MSFGLTVSRRQGDLDLDDLVPLLIGPVALGDGEQFTESPTGILGR
ncbi:MAG: hypothetical protein JNK99_15435 [Candidatus Accumulibacter sp.]|nr:hypothetical protein [Accumulibacter sp.]MBL8396113.1 hypothetical protein [Accumulibacter sp.]